MTYFWRDSEVCIQQTLKYPMRPWERICELSEALQLTLVGHNKGNNANVVRPDYIHSTQYSGRGVITQNKHTHDYVISDAADIA